MVHFVTSYMNQNKKRKQTHESAHFGLEITFKTLRTFSKPSARYSKHAQNKRQF